MDFNQNDQIKHGHDTDSGSPILAHERNDITAQSDQKLTFVRKDTRGRRGSKQVSPRKSLLLPPSRMKGANKKKGGAEAMDGSVFNMAEQPGLQRQKTVDKDDIDSKVFGSEFNQPRRTFQKHRSSAGNLALVNKKVSENKLGKNKLNENNQTQQISTNSSLNTRIEEEPLEKAKYIETTWELFKKVDQLGSGSFGSVLRVECLESTRLNMNDGNGRVIMNQKALQKANLQRARVNGQKGVIQYDQYRSMFKNEHYVIKTVSLSSTGPEEMVRQQTEALNEIEVMLAMNSPHIVGYYDSFIDGDTEIQETMNIVHEYCAHGDLCNYLLKQDHSKLIPEPLVWKLLIHICLGVEHMHYKNYIHRDLKTLNIFLTKDNIARVGDLGLAMKIQPPEEKDPVINKTAKDEELAKDEDTLLLKDEEQLMDKLSLIDQQYKDDQGVEKDEEEKEEATEDKLSDETIQVEVEKVEQELKLQDAMLQLDNEVEGDDMLLDEDPFAQEDLLMDMIDDEDYEVAGENRDTMLVERDTTILNNIKKSMSSKHESQSMNLYSEHAVGTPLYIAPEVWANKHYSKAADVWAIGIILHETATLKHPFSASTKEELKRKVCTEQLSKQKNSLRSEELESLIHKMLVKDPEQRPSLEEIILEDNFQKRAKQIVNLPLRLNKERQLQLIQSLKLDKLRLTPYSRKLFKKELQLARSKIDQLEQEQQEQLKKINQEKEKKNSQFVSPMKKCQSKPKLKN